MSTYVLTYSLKNFLKIFLNILVILLFIFSILLASANLLGRPTFIAITNGYSMYPVLKSGDIVIAIPEPLAGKITNGSIIVFRDPDYGKIPGYPPYIIHEVVSVLPNDTFITKGVNDNFIDQIYMPPVTPSEIYAKAVLIDGKPLVIPYLGQILLSARGNIITTIVIFAILIAVLVGIDERKKIRRVALPRRALLLFFTIVLFSIFIIISSTSTYSFFVVYSVSHQEGILAGGVNEVSAINLQVLLYNQSKSYTFSVTDKLMLPEVVIITVEGNGTYTVNPKIITLYPGKSELVNLTVVGKGYEGLHQLLIKVYVIVALIPLGELLGSPLYTLFLYSALDTLCLLFPISVIIARGEEW
ncbi:hypothetical protein BFU36_00540 [Sulfolobus sp. A20]|uniref:S24/S26 family peptidase n=1 Tax=Sulfolobaceae TaxID=118883 RepID=UPI000845C1D2|nr:MULTISPECIES: S24/S26 family peptidase [unclassified Sulfolobus]TRM76580.1 hypothetical protein DJ523_00670 [Sulfolobus sp. E5]TRM78825.1 hypothetical protein DJ528_04105 [Sulfolobus sp. B5]TRM83193.1 hypothetical protein DJ531_06525 [Sulfolobus sp. A20-N-F6]TRM87159.1 hypothetical protein DJ529_09355 [Sulfolobus sp. C3]TRN03459.1 hypothetical protein DJ527_02040 [Sulfolobus sp. F1]